MKKLTKLLSVLLVTGAVGSGAAALAACNSEPPHVHSGVKTEAKAATCLEDGNKEYYTCTCEELAGKYFSDADCTQEITDGITVAAQGHHDFVYTDKGNGTHGKTCEHGDFTEEVEAHVDEKVNASGEEGFDNLCDICGAKFFVAGKFYNESSAMELEVKADGTVVFNSETYTLSEISDEGSATFTVNETQYTLTKTENGYSLSYEFYGTQFVKEFIPMPEELVTEKADFAGVYEGSFVYAVTDTVYDEYGNPVYDGEGKKKEETKYYKIYNLSICENGDIIYNEMQVDNADGTVNEGNSYTPVIDIISTMYSQLKYNSYTGDSFTITALTKGAATIEVKYVGIADESVTATFTKDANATAPTVPTELPVLADGDKYVNTDMSHMLKKDSFGTCTLDNNSIYLISEETVEGNKVVLIRTIDSSWNKINYKLTFITVGEATTIKVADVSGKELYTLTLKPKAATPDLVADGATENKAECDDKYGFFKVTQTGWYQFTATNTSLKIYTEVNESQPNNPSGAISFSTSTTSKYIYLTADTIIAADKSWSDDPYTYTFTATYSATDPHVYEAISGSSYKIESFNSSAEYCLKGTAATAGKYIVTVANSNYLDRGACFTINGTKYGYDYDNMSWKLVVAEGGLAYEATLAAGDEVKLIVTCGSTIPLGDVTVFFETESENTARLEAEKVAPTFSGDQLDTYKKNNHTYAVSADGVTYNGSALTFVKKISDTYFYELNGANHSIKFNADGGLDVFYDGDSFTAPKYVPFSGFAEEQQGVYTATGKYTNRWGEEGTYTITLTVGADSFKYKFDDGSGYGDTYTLNFSSEKDSVYVWADNYGYSITFSFVSGNIVVSEDMLNYYNVTEYTATKSTGGSEEGGGLVLGENTISEFDDDYLAEASFTATEAGDYKFDFSNFTAQEAARLTTRSLR